MLDNDIGSVGPIRRIRQKQSLLSSRGLSPPVSGSLSISGAGFGSVAAQKPSSSMHRKTSTENEESTMPGTSFSSVPTRSSEMASKILQQLDKLVSPKDKSSGPKLFALMDKSPTKLSPSMLHGQALKSLEAVDSSKLLRDVQDNKLDGSLDKTILDARDSSSLKQDMVKENGPLKIVASCDKPTAVVNGIDSAVLKENTLMSTETTVSATPIFVASPPQKKRAFQMSAHEVFCFLSFYYLPIYIYMYIQLTIHIGEWSMNMISDKVFLINDCIPRIIKLRSYGKLRRWFLHRSIDVFKGLDDLS